MVQDKFLLPSRYETSPRFVLMGDDDERTRVTDRELTDLYESQVRAVLRYCALRLGSRCDAEDATAEVFARLIAARDRVRVETAGAWVFRVARNVCHDQLRRRVREAPALADLQQTAGQREPWVDSPMRELVGRLTPGQQQVVLLRLVEDLPFAEIGRLTGRPEVAVRMQYHRAVIRLRAAAKKVERCAQSCSETE